MNKQLKIVNLAIDQVNDRVRALQEKTFKVEFIGKGTPPEDWLKHIDEMQAEFDKHVNKLLRLTTTAIELREEKDKLQ